MNVTYTKIEKEVAGNFCTWYPRSLLERYQRTMNDVSTVVQHTKQVLPEHKSKIMLVLLGHYSPNNTLNLQQHGSENLKSRNVCSHPTTYTPTHYLPSHPSQFIINHSIQFYVLIALWTA
jgi:hypothetical protein